MLWLAKSDFRCSPCRVPDACDLHQGLRTPDSVDDSTRPSNDLADSGIVKFGNSSPRLGVLRQSLGGFEYAANEPAGRARIVLGDVPEQIAKVLSGRWRPL